MDKTTFMELVSNEELYEAYQSFFNGKVTELGEDFPEFEKWYTRDFLNGVEKGKNNKRELIRGENLFIREADLEDADYMSNVECDQDNSPWVANWPLGWRVAKLGDADFLQTILVKEDGSPIGFIIFRNMVKKEEAVELKRIAIMEKGKGYGVEALHLAQKLAFEVWGTKRLYLSTKLSNLRAQSIYKKTGFVAEMPDPCDHFHMDREDYEALC